MAISYLIQVQKVKYYQP